LPLGLEITLAPERLDEGSPEEKAAFGLVTIRTPHSSLTEGFDYFIKGYRPGPLVSGYHLAEWFAWNWWRLRWEPRSAVPDWPPAHCMTSIGEGFVWPNIVIFSDGVRSALISHPSARPDAKPFRYVGALPLVVPSTLFEAAIDAFLPQIVGRLREAGLVETNFDRLWGDILAERSDPEVAKRRRLEALLGRDPDAVSDGIIEALLADANRLGQEALGEIAANRAQAGPQADSIVTAAAFEELAERLGYEASRRNAARLAPGTLPPRGADIPAWRVGAGAARALREQERLGTEPIANARLTAMAGAKEEALSDRGASGADLSFALDKSARASRIVLRSKWVTGRRFDLARLIGDRLIAPDGGLHPATRAYTYRQKAQRSFAAELLSPFEAVDGMMAADYSEERQQDVAEYFDVSPMTINTLLKNHGRLPREAAEQDFDVGVPEHVA
jgi:hypothetical protein